MIMATAMLRALAITMLNRPGLRTEEYQCK